MINLLTIEQDEPRALLPSQLAERLACGRVFQGTIQGQPLPRNRRIWLRVTDHIVCLSDPNIYPEVVTPNLMIDDYQPLIAKLVIKKERR